MVVGLTPLSRESITLLGVAVVIAVAMGLLTTGMALGFGPMLFRAVGGAGPALDQALSSAGILVGGAVLVWLANIRGAALRGAVGQPGRGGEVLPRRHLLVETSWCQQCRQVWGTAAVPVRVGKQSAQR